MRLIEAHGSAETRQTLSGLQKCRDYFEGQTAAEEPLTRDEILSTLTRDFRRSAQPAVRIKILDKLSELESGLVDQYEPDGIDYAELERDLAGD